MESVTIFEPLLILLGISLLIVYLFQRLRVSPIIGYLITGALVGPTGLSLIDSTSEVTALANIGLILLLFTVGLEMPTPKITNLRAFSLGSGFLQITVTTAAAFGILLILNFEPPQALLFGFIIALSSTAIIIKLLLDRAETDTIQGRLVLGILIFQDLAAILVLALLPFVSEAGRVSVAQVALSVLQMLAVILVFLAVGRYLIPRFLYTIVRTRSKELFIIASLFLVFGTAWLASNLGLSLAIGAFIAGLVLSESEYSHQLMADILPFREVFMSLFFISVGMLISLQFFFQNLPLLIVLAIAVIFAKSILTTFVVIGARYPIRIALIVGLSIAQIGEFSFILLQESFRLNLVSLELHQGFLSMIALTMLTTPILTGVATPLAERTMRLLSLSGFEQLRREEEAEVDLQKTRGHVIICGYGLNGRNLARILRLNSIPYIIVDVNGEVVREEQLVGEPIQYGDCSNPQVLMKAGVLRAQSIVFAISDPLAIRRAVKLARDLNPDLSIIVRTKYFAEIDDLFQLGATEVVTEEFEASIEIMSRLLRYFDVPHSQIRDQIRKIRQEKYGLFRALKIPWEPWQQWEELRLRSGFEAENYRLTETSPAIGKTLVALELRARTGASIIAVVRDGETIVNPPADTVLEAGDEITLLGKAQEKRDALAILLGNKG